MATLTNSPRMFGKVTKANHLRACELAVIEAAKNWVDLFEKHVDHEVPLLPHNKAMWEAVRNLKAAKERA